MQLLIDNSMKYFQLTAAVFVSILLLMQCSASASSDRSDMEEVMMQAAEDSLRSDFDSTRLTTMLPAQIKQLKSFIKQKGIYDNKVAFLIDMRIPSKYYRLFVVNLKNDSIMDRALVAHGSGSELEGTDSLQFSNTPNSYMTSLGTYKIGAAYIGNFGRSFKLHGLDPTNSKALARAVVLHRYSCVPDEEQAYPICNSLGCPMVSETFFPVLEKYIDAAAKPVLMEIYY